MIRALVSDICLQASGFRVHSGVEGDRIRRFVPSETHTHTHTHMCVCVCVCVCVCASVWRGRRCSFICGVETNASVW